MPRPWWPWWLQERMEKGEWRMKNGGIRSILHSAFSLLHLRPQGVMVPDCPLCHHRWPGLVYCSRCGPACAACQATESEVVALLHAEDLPRSPGPTRELATWGCLGAVLLVGGWVVGWAVVRGVYALGRLLNLSIQSPE